VLATVNVSGNAPTVAITDPAGHEDWGAGTTQTLSWTGSDADGDPLTYSVFYSHDGATFEALATGLTTTNYNIDVDSIAGGVAAILRVVASDGVNTGFGDSPTVSVPNKPPFVAITNPGNGTLVPEGGLAVLDGAATDLEDPFIKVEGLRWSSSVDGVLGTGESLALNTLSAGPHTITLRATDSEGAFSEESVQIIVGLPMTIDVQPDTISSAGPPPDVTVIVTLPPGYPTGDIDTATLKLLIGNTELEPTGVQQLGDTDNDGLPELKLTFDGAAVQAALPDGPDSAEATLGGELGDGTLAQGSDIIGLTLAGDADCDGAVDSVDALQVLRHVAGLGKPDCLAVADVDCSGEINSVDSLKILRFVAGLPQTGLPADCPGIAPVVLTLNAVPGANGGLPSAAWLGALLAVPALVAVRRRRTR
jgi:hypothetical protein